MSATEERIALEDIPLTLAVDYYNPEDTGKPIFRRIAGKDPFIALEMKQVAGSVQVAVTASVIPDDQDLIETMEVVLTALVEERANRLSAEALRAAAEASERGEDEVDEVDRVFDSAVDDYFDEEQARRHEDESLREMTGGR